MPNINHTTNTRSEVYSTNLSRFIAAYRVELGPEFDSFYDWIRTVMKSVCHSEVQYNVTV
jgi:hypothetical protein